MAFDPVAYLAGKEKKEFDPVAYLAMGNNELQAAQPSKLEKFIKTGELNVSPPDSALRGFVMGGADPTVGAVQYIANIVGAGDKINEAIKAKEAEYQAGRELSGRDGTDWMRLAGNVASPTTLLPMTAISKAAPAMTAFEKIRQGSGIGGATALSMPVTEDGDFGEKKTEQALSGMAFGAAIPAATSVAGAVYRGGRNIIAPVVSKEAADLGAARIANAIAGKDANQIIQMLRNGEIDETAVQAAIKSGRPEFASLGEMIKKRLPGEYDRIALEQAALPQAQLGRLARGDTSEESRIAQAEIKGRLEAGLRPLREEQLASANAGTINTSAIYDRIGQIASNPKYAGNKYAEKALGEVDSLIRRWEDANGGVIDADALYSIRKDAVNQTINDLLKGQDPKAASKVAAGLEAKIRPLIDDAIENAGGNEWRTYLRQYSKGLKQVDRIALLDKAREIYRKNPSKFLDLVKGDSPKVIQKIMKGTYTREDSFNPQTVAKLEKIARQIERDSEVTRQAKLGMDVARKSYRDIQDSYQGVPLLSRPMVLFTNVVNRLEGKGGANIDESLAELMLPRNKGRLADLMEKAAPSQKRLFLNELLRQGYISGAASEAGRRQGD